MFSLSFEGLADSAYADEEKLYAAIAYQMADAFEWTPLEGLDKEVSEYISAFYESHDEKCCEKDLAKFINNVCHRNSKPVVVLIDEVDETRIDKSVSFDYKLDSDGFVYNVWEKRSQGLGFTNIIKVELDAHESAVFKIR